jgi:hypothetical protein
MRAREMLAIIAQDLFFFDDRQPAPARRTYNQDFGAAAKWSLLEWLMGIVPWDAETVEEQNNAGGPHGFLPDGGWMALCDVLVRGVLDANDFALPAPRQMRGRFVDELGYTSYFHKDFVLGTFDRWQPLTVYKQHESDIPVAFEGAARDLVYFGAYSIDAEDALKTHPGTGKVGMPSKTSLPTLTYAAAQEANVCCLLTNIRGFSCDLKEYGWMLRGLQYQGKLFNKEGCELTGKGTVENEWVFLATEDYFTGVCPLTRFDPTHKNLLESLPTSLHYEFSDNGLFITAPNFKVDTPIEVKGDNLPGGAILVLGSAKDGDLDAFRSACLACTIEDEWYVDGFLTREGNRDCERRIGISAPGAELRLAFDYRRDQVVHRSFNGRPIKTPLELSAVRIGVHPWGVPMA